jgi:hypothetical protein
MSLLQELARRVLNDEAATSAREAIAARLSAAGATLKRATEIGARDLVGVNADQVAQPDPTMRIALPTRPAAPQLEPVALPVLDTEATALRPELVEGSSERDGQFLTWNEVLVRRKRGQRSPTADDQQTVQFAFL